MKALVTGAAGFIGAHLTRKLADSGHEVVAVDVAQCAPDLTARANVEPVMVDIRDAATIASAMQGVEVVFHQAALASVPASFANPVKCMDVNVVGSTVVFEQARLAGVQRVVMASTSAIYGDDPTPVKHEGLTPYPRSPYAVSKLSMEQLANVYAQQYGMEMIALRYFNVYGPGQSAEGGYAAVIPAIRKAQVTGEPFKMYGDGQQTRSFIYVEDVVRANWSAANAPVDFGGKALIANLAGEESVSLNMLLDVFQKIGGKQVPVEVHPARTGDVRDSAGDVSVARERFGFSTETSLEVGIRKLVVRTD